MAEKPDKYDFVIYIKSRNLGKSDVTTIQNAYLDFLQANDYTMLDVIPEDETESIRKIIVDAPIDAFSDGDENLHAELVAIYNARKKGHPKRDWDTKKPRPLLTRTDFGYDDKGNVLTNKKDFKSFMRKSPKIKELEKLVDKLDIPWDNKNPEYVKIIDMYNDSIRERDPSSLSPEKEPAQVVEKPKNTPKKESGNAKVIPPKADDDDAKKKKKREEEAIKKAVEENAKRLQEEKERLEEEERARKQEEERRERAASARVDQEKNDKARRERENQAKNEKKEVQREKKSDSGSEEDGKPQEWTVENVLGRGWEGAGVKRRRDGIIAFIGDNDPALLQIVYPEGDGASIGQVLVDIEDAGELGPGGNVYEDIKKLYDARHGKPSGGEEKSGELAAAKLEIERLLKKNGQLATEIKEIEESQQKNLDEIEALGREQKLAKERIRVLESQMSVIQRDATARDTDLKKTEENLRQAEEDKTKLQQSVLAKEQELKTQKGQLETAKQSLDAANRTASQLQAEKQAWEKEKTRLTKAAEDAATEKNLVAGGDTETKRLLEESRKALRELTEKKEKAAEEAAEVNSKLGDAITKLETENNELRSKGGASMDGLNEKIEELKVTIKEKEKLLTKAKNELSVRVRKDELERVDEELTQMTIANGDKTKQIQELGTKLSEAERLKKEAQASATSSDEARLLREKEVEELKKEKNGLEDRINELTGQLAASGASSLSASEKDGRIRALTTELAQTNTELQRVRDELSQAQASNKTLEDNLKKQPIDASSPNNNTDIVFYKTNQFGRKIVAEATRLLVKGDVVLSANDFDYINKHWKIYIKLQIPSVAGILGSFRVFVDSPVNSDLYDNHGDPVRDPSQFGFQYQILTTGVRKADGKEKTIDLMGAIKSRALTMGDHIAAAQFNALALDAVGEYSIRVRFFDREDRPVLAFVASQLAFHTLGAGRQVFVLDMEKNADNLTYTEVTAMGRKMITNPGYFQFQIADKGAWFGDLSPKFPFEIPPPSVVDEKYAFGVPAITTFADGVVEMLTSYVTPGLASIERITLQDDRTDAPSTEFDEEEEPEAIVTRDASNYIVLYPDINVKTQATLYESLRDFLSNDLDGRQIVDYTDKGAMKQVPEGAKKIFVTLLMTTNTKADIEAKTDYMEYAKLTSDPIIIALVSETDAFLGGIGPISDVLIFRYDHNTVQDKESLSFNIQARMDLKKRLVPSSLLKSSANVASFDAYSETIYEIVEMPLLASDMDSLSETEDYFGEEY